MLHYIGCRLSTSRLRIGVCLYTLPLWSDSSINTYSSALPPLRTRFSALHGGRLIIQRSTVLDVPPYTFRYHISSSHASIIYIQQYSLLLFVFVVWSGMVCGVQAKQGQRQAYQESSGLHFRSVALHHITSFFPSPSFSRTFRAHLFT
jgi:hypothetical protein